MCEPTHVKLHNQFYSILEEINPSILKKEVANVYNKFIDHRINFDPNGLFSIQTLLYKILIPYWEYLNIPSIKLKSLKSYNGSWILAKPLRNVDSHDPNIDETFLINSISICMKCFRALEEFENVLKCVNIDTNEL